VEIATALSSPRSWGCFPKTISIEGNVSVFPTLVGVFLSMVGFLSLVASLPHARGGVSITDEPIQRHTMSSPRSWGCFQYLGQRDQQNLSLPHARGGVSSDVITS